MVVRRVQETDREALVRMRAALWPDTSAGDHRVETAELFGAGQEAAAFVALDEAGAYLGFAEATLRPFVEGCATRPVGYLEGWWVVPEARQTGVGRALVAAVEAWAKKQGCRELASDCLLDNTVSCAAHQRLGFEETSRIIQFRKGIDGA
jgi:aminoglycoside 6'-N-acetyltransferase I